MRQYRHYLAVSLGIGLILAGFLIGWTVIFWGSFCDEGDNLAMGKWINHGLLPYRDLFSHHFPFVYYWLSVVFRYFGESIFAARMSVLGFEAVTMLLLAVTTRQYIATGLFYFTWSLLAPYYFGNMVLYQRFSAFAAVFVFGTALSMISGLRKITYPRSILIGFYSGVAILSYPIMGWFCLFSFVLVGIVSRGRIKTVAAVLMCSGMIGLTAMFLVLTGSWSAFIDQAIRFNTEIYSKYGRCNINLIDDVIPVAFRLLDLFDPRWFTGSMQMTWAKLHSIDQSMMTGFTYRFSVIVLTLGCIVRRRFVSAFYVYGSGAILTSIHSSHFRLMPFIFIALYSLALLATGWLQAVECSGRTPDHVVPRAVMRGLQFAALAALINLQFQFSRSTYSDANRLKYDVTFGDIERLAAEIEQVVQYDKSIPVAFYPGFMEMNFFLKNPPVGKYLYLWPWVAEVGMDEAISALRSQEAVLVLNVRGTVWGKPCQIYLKRMNAFAQKECWNHRGDIYLSPRLAERIVPEFRFRGQTDSTPTVNYSKSPQKVLEQVKK